ncbi:MAG: CshA/CshB family fibrillar adhesin-related protein, partial [Bifidobacteriaceae bacterium]|nr:CshA/CshB family fibrillar adhesin-related protein [Bifidobacteriaceae bacterium]
MRRSLAAVAVLAICCPLITVVNDRPAAASFAAGGEGRFRGVIDWFEWGKAVGDPILPGTVTNERYEGDTKIITRCTISETITSALGHAQPLRVKRPGSWRKDGFDNLYNVGGTDNNNQMMVGIANTQDADQVGFDVSCSMVLKVDGDDTEIPVKLPGLVVSDAEASGNALGEWMEAKPLDPGFKTWRVIDRYRGQNCSVSTIARVSADQTMRMSPTSANECDAQETPVNSGVYVGGGPTAVAFMEGSTSAHVAIKGGGTSAVAIGVVSIIDWADAPESYGAAGVLAFPPWSGGELPVGETDLYAAGFQLANLLTPEVRLGSLVDGEELPPHSADAKGDDRNAATNDEDLNVPAVITGYRGGSVVLNDLVCAGGGRIWGWIDFNHDSKFQTAGAKDKNGDDANEMGGPVPPAGQPAKPDPIACNPLSGVGENTFDIAWQVPVGAVPQPAGKTAIVRIGITTDQRVTTEPIGVAVQGELEDHAVDFLLDPYEVIKTSNLTADSRVGDVIEYTVRITTPPASGSSEPPAQIAVVDDLRELLDDADWLGPSSAEGAFSFDSAQRQLTWRGKPPAPGQSKELTYRVRLKSGGDGEVKNVAWIDNSAVDDIPTCDLGEGVTSGRDPVTDEPCARADSDTPRLTIAKTFASSVAPADLRASDTVTYTVTAKNEGPGDFTQTAPAVIWDDLSGVLDDADLRTASVSANREGTLVNQADGADPVIGWYGPLPAGESVVLTYRVALKAAGDGLARNVAWIANPDPDSSPPAPGAPADRPACQASPDAATGELCAVVELKLPKAQLAKTVETPGDAMVGTPLEFTVAATNTGRADFGPARPLVLADDLTDVMDGLIYNGDVKASID